MTGISSVRQPPVEAFKEATTLHHSKLISSADGRQIGPANHQGQPQSDLACIGVWGGNREVAFEGQLPGLAAWVYSAPLESAGGGDVHYRSACDEGRLSRIVLADVNGHGAEVDTVAQSLLHLMRRYINTWDQSDFMRDLGRAFRQAQAGSQYATAVVLGFHRELSQVAYTNAGHPAPLWFHASEKRWGLLTESTAPGTVSSGLPLGLILGTEYQQTFVTLAPGDLLILNTDAMIEAENQAGEQLGGEGLFELATALPTDSPEAAGRGLLSEVHRFSGDLGASDDETLIVIQRIGSPHLPLQGPRSRRLARAG